ncbi:MAG TPA: acyl-CoA synthetase FdrA [Symbiobacteriaceae bacterium]
MVVRVLVRPDSYFDSVSLMAVSQRLKELPEVADAVAIMGTEMNKRLLEGAGLLTAESAAAAPADLVIAVGAETESAAAEAIAEAGRLLQRRGGAATGAAGGASESAWSGAAAQGAQAPRTIRSAVKAEPGASLALISVPGLYAAREARMALARGLHVMLFSDNVPLEAEVALKQLAHEQGLLLMGPDCGTAILNGVGLGFANAVRRGSVGIVAASGTGAQELSTLIDRLGGGVSQLIGTGGRDLSPAVGGRMTLDGLRLLQADPATAVIVMISKPPAPAVAEAVRAAAQAGSKPVVLCFLNGGLSIDAAAVRAISLATGEAEAAAAARLAIAADDRPPFAPAPGRRLVRGLFAGGTLCDQALLVLERALGPVACNVHPDPDRRCGPTGSAGHTLLDLGDDELTQGRPHPMIDPTLRRQLLLEAADDPETAVILLDVVLGHGAHPDPAGALTGAIFEAVSRGVAVVASVTGTEADPQRRSAQVAALRQAGAVVLPTALQAASAVATGLAGLQGSAGREARLQGSAGSAGLQGSAGREARLQERREDA